MRTNELYGEDSREPFERSKKGRRDNKETISK